MKSRLDKKDNQIEEYQGQINELTDVVFLNKNSQF